MHYLYRVNRLQCDTGAQKSSTLAELVILQPQRPLKRTKVVGYNVEQAEPNQLFLFRLSAC
jgi:hypothetical protein